MEIPFDKMHGAGNDFVVVDGRGRGELAAWLSPARIEALSDRNTGIGCDQFVVLEAPVRDPDAAARLRFFNADGSEAGACGNATRCVASLLGSGRPLVLEGPAGRLVAEILAPGQVRVDMGQPALGWRDIPLAGPADTLNLELEGDPAAVSMGNPHATFFVADLAVVDPAALGPGLETHPIFPQRANIGFAQILGKDAIRLRVWERGAGLTRACGSGACATLVNAVRRGLAERRASLILDGGVLEIDWREDSGHVWMAGPAVHAFRGSVDLATYPG